MTSHWGNSIKMIQDVFNMLFLLLLLQETIFKYSRNKGEVGTALVHIELAALYDFILVFELVLPHVTDWNCLWVPSLYLNS